jgi:Pyridoxamine 5'-phosphate oxidase
MAPPRSAQQRRQDTLARLESDVDAWIATAGDGGPYLVPLSYLWDGRTVVISTPANSPTSRNLRATGKVRVGIGPTRDLVLIEGTVEMIGGRTDIPDELAAAFADRTGFDPRRETADYAWFRITPRRLQAWREANELTGRDLIRDGEWLVTD